MEGALPDMGHSCFKKAIKTIHTLILANLGVDSHFQDMYQFFLRKTKMSSGKEA
jgi:hypothetical protein